MWLLWRAKTGGKTRVDSAFLVKFLEERRTPIIKKKYHSYLSYRGIKEDYIYILKEGVVKTSVIMRDGREFNFSYLKATDIVSLLRDEVSNYTDSPFNVRVETAEASFYRIPRVKFWTFVKEKKELQDYVRDYYRNKLSESMESQQYIDDEWKKKASVLFSPTKAMQLVWGGAGTMVSWLILNITNEDIAGFCGISTRNSVNRILNELKREGVLDIRQQKIVILDIERIEEFIGRETF